MFPSQKRSVEGGKQGAPIKKLKKDKAINSTAKAVRPETNTVPTAPRVKPELALPVMYYQEPCLHFSSVHIGFVFELKL